MKFISELSSVVFLISSLIFSGCGDDLSGKVVIAVSRNLKAPVAAVNIPVVIQDIDGQVLDSGHTDANGTFITQKALLGSSVSITSKNGSDEFVQTIYGVEPGTSVRSAPKSYLFVLPPTTTPSTPLGTLRVKVPALSLGESAEVIVGGGGRGDGLCQSSVFSDSSTLIAEIELHSECVEKDGKLTVFASRINSETFTTRGYAAKMNVTWILGGKTTVQLNEWKAFEEAQKSTLKVSNLPYGQEIHRLQPIYFPRRNGAIYQSWPLDYGDRFFQNSKFGVPREFFQDDRPNLTFLRGIEVFLNVGKTRLGGGVLQSNSAAYQSVVFDLKRDFLDLNVSFNPKTLEWVGSSDYDAALLTAHWSKPDGGFVYWSALAPQDAGEIKAPLQLGSDPQFVLIDASWVSGYDDFVQKRSMLLGETHSSSVGLYAARGFLKGLWSLTGAPSTEESIKFAYPQQEISP